MTEYTQQEPTPPPTELLPYTGTFGKKELIHLLRRTLFGVTKTDLNYFKNKSLQQVVAELTSVSAAPAPPIRAYANFDWSSNSKEPLYINKTTLIDPTVDPKTKFGETWVAKTFDVSNDLSTYGHRLESFKSWWLGLMITQKPNIIEKMTFFWTNHFGTQANIVGLGQMSYQHNMLLRSHALGNFKTMVRDVTLDAGMLWYLNGYKNTKVAPDENYARELQELFCLGKGNDSKYTEADIQAASRLLTGWYFRYADAEPKALFNADTHDSGNKQFSQFYGNRLIQGSATEAGARAEINALLSMIFAHNELAKYIVRRLYTFFVYYDHLSPEVETNVIEPLATIFRDSGYNIKSVVTALLTSAHFFKAEYQGSMIKSHLDFVVTHIRQSGVTFSAAGNNYEIYHKIMFGLADELQKMGQGVNEPPNVAGFPAYYQYPQFHQMWIDSSSYVYRKKFYEAYSQNNMVWARDYAVLPNTKTANVVADYVKFVENFDNPSNPNALIDEAVEVCLGSPLSQSVKNTLKLTILLKGQTSDYYWTSAYNTYRANPNTADPTARQVPQILRDLFKHLFSSAEYHLQ